MANRNVRESRRPIGLVVAQASSQTRAPHSGRNRFEKFPQRHFVLVGDSGERDPETYGTLARKYPKQVIRILIRDVTGTTADATRYKKAFHDLPGGHWQIFREPAEISPIIREPVRDE